jgi:hypothetical protein
VADDFGEHLPLAGLDRFLTSGAGDVSGVDGRLPWSSRPEAAALLAELSSPGRRFDAVVVGEYGPAFSGDQFARVMALLERVGVQMWLPEAGGRWDWRHERSVHGEHWLLAAAGHTVSSPSEIFSATVAAVDRSAPSATRAR